MSVVRRAIAALVLGAGVLAWPAAFAAGWPAGADISNTASVTWDESGDTRTVNSNTDTFKVDEVLDLTLVQNDVGRVNATTPDTDVPLSFTLTNVGNGEEAFRLVALGTLPADDFDPQNIRLYLDNGDGVFGSGTDTLYVAGSNDPLLTPDASRVVFVVANVPASLAAGAIGLVSLQATAVTGSGVPGTTFPGAGTDGTDAVVGATTADATVQNGYAVAQVTTTLLKSQSVLDTDGGSLARSGSTITYTLVFSVSGSGTVQSAQIQDPIPAGTTYVPGSLTLDSVPLTDAADADAGRYTGSQVEVVPGTAGGMAAPATATVTFQVTID